MFYKTFQDVNVVEIKVQIANHILTWKPSPDFNFYDGSEMIKRITEGGLDAFKVMDEEQMSIHRQLAIDAIREECTETGRIGIVAGHYMLPSKDQETVETIGTRNDLATFTHMLYLNVPAETVAQRCRDDRGRKRHLMHVERIQEWQDDEQKALRKVCRDNKILFRIISGVSPTLVADVVMMLRDFQRHADSSQNDVIAREDLGD